MLPCRLSILNPSDGVLGNVSILSWNRMNKLQAKYNWAFVLLLRFTPGGDLDFSVSILFAAASATRSASVMQNVHRYQIFRPFIANR